MRHSEAGFQDFYPLPRLSAIIFLQDFPELVRPIFPTSG